MTRSPEQIRDEILVLRCQDGDEDAFAELVSRWQRRLYAHALQLTGRPDVARDAVQETWIAIIRGLPQLHDPASFGGFAHRILSRRCADSSRGQGRRAKLARAISDAGSRVSQPTAERDSDSSRVREALAGLPAERRAVLALHYLNELSVPEIARILRVPQGTIKSRLHDARAHLERALRPRRGRCPS